jgi:hypothetical protein
MSSWLGTPVGVPIRVAPSSDVDLRLDDVDAGHLLGDGVLDLDARVHLDEVELARVHIHQELDRAGADIVGRRAIFSARPQTSSRCASVR